MHQTARLALIGSRFLLTRAAPPARLGELLCTAWLLVCLATGPSHGQAAGSSNSLLGPALEKALGEFVNQCVPERRRQLAAHLDEVVKEVDATAKLTPAEREVVQNAATQAVDESLKTWRKPFAAALRKRLGTLREPIALRSISRLKPDEIPAHEPVEGAILPEETRVWSETLERTLGEQRHAAWRPLQDARRRKRAEAVDDYVRRWSADYQSSLERTLRLRTESLAKAVNSSPERLEELNKPAQLMVKRLVESETRRVTPMLRGLTSAGWQWLSGLPYFHLRPSFLGTEFDGAWQAAVNPVLTAAEREAWVRYEADEKARFEKELPNLLKPTLTEMRDQWLRTLDAQVDFAALTLNLPAERTQAFEQAKNAAMERVEQRWTEYARDTAKEMNTETRQQLLKRGRYYVALDESELPHHDPVWTDALQTGLTPEERRRLETAHAERRTRRKRIMGQIMLAEMDQRVALTTDQRERLQPIAERVIEMETELFREPLPYSYFDLRPQLFLAAARKVSEAELTSFVDERQRTHWRTTTEAAEAERTRQPGAAPAAPPAPPVKPVEPEDVEHRISDFLHARSTDERRRVIAVLMLKAEDATRVANLPEQTAARLITAAKGAGERVLGAWKSATEQRVRSQLSDVTAQNVHQRLASLDNYQFNSGSSLAPANDIVWTSTVANELTDQQRAMWKKEIDARNRYRERTMVLTAMAEFDRKHMLASSQWQQLESRIQTIVRDYLPDMENYFSYSQPWHLQSYSALLPFAGVAEKDLKGVLTKTQWENWTREDLGNCSNYWSAIKETHDNRLGKKP